MFDLRNSSNRRLSGGPKRLFWAILGGCGSAGVFTVEPKPHAMVMDAITRSYPGVLPGLNSIFFNLFSGNQIPSPFPQMPSTVENLLAEAGNGVFSPQTQPPQMVEPE